MSTRAEKTDKVLGYIQGGLGLIPDLPGNVDDVAITSAKALIATARALLQSGRDPAELVAALRELREEGAPRLDVDAVVDDWLAKNTGDE